MTSRCSFAVRCGNLETNLREPNKTSQRQLFEPKVRRLFERPLCAPLPDHKQPAEKVHYLVLQLAVLPVTRLDHSPLSVLELSIPI